MSFSSNSVIAKSRAVYGKSLTREQLFALSEKRSVGEAAAFLKGTVRYGGALAGVNPATVHRGQLEAILDKTIFAIFDDFRRFDYTESRWYFREIVARLEAEQILCAIQGVADGSTDSYIAALPAFVSEHSALDLLELGRAQSFGDISAILSGSAQGKLLQPLLTEAEKSGRVNIRECERRLFTRYYLDCMKNLGKNSRRAGNTELKRVFLKSIDMKNVVTCVRMRAFGFGADEVSAQLIPFRYRLNAEAVERIMQLPDIPRTEAALAELGYRTDGKASFSTVEQLTERISLDYFRRTMRLSRSSATVYFCLIECLETELRNIKTLIEGIRYGIPAAELREMLVL